VFTVKSTNIAHIYEIVNMLSDISRHEIEAFGYTPWTFLKDANVLLDSEGAEVKTGFVEGKPVVVVGTFPNGQISDLRSTMLVASKRFFELGAPMVRYGRRYIRTVVDRRPGCRFAVYTRSAHPDVTRWFRLLGFAGPVDDPLAGDNLVFEMYGKRRDDAKTKC
jgi:hypothetical protein